MDPVPPPGPTGVIQEIRSLDGMLIYAANTPLGAQPFYLQIAGGPEALPVFTSLETARRFETEYGLLLEPTHRLKKIDDTAEFLASVPDDLSVVLDVRKTERGTVKYLELRLEGRRWLAAGAPPPDSGSPGSTPAPLLPDA